MKTGNFRIAELSITKIETVIMMPTIMMVIMVMKIAVVIVTLVNTQEITVGIPTEKKIVSANIAEEWMKKEVMVMALKADSEPNVTTIQIQAVTDLKTTVAPDAETD
jgi:hypothetical protein